MKGLYFLLGVGVGAAGAYFFLKDKFAQQAEEEINSVKEAYGQALDKVNGNEKKNEEELVKVKDEKPPIREYFKKIDEGGYKDYSTKVDTSDPIHKPFNPEAEIITPDEYEELKDYDKESLILYADGVLAYETNDEQFEDAEEKLTPDFKDHIGEYEDNVVYIRNDVEKTDYAIYKDERTYEEVSGIKPHPVKVEE